MAGNILNPNSSPMKSSLKNTAALVGVLLLVALVAGLLLLGLHPGRVQTTATAASVAAAPTPPAASAPAISAAATPTPVGVTIPASTGAPADQKPAPSPGNAELAGTLVPPKVAANAILDLIQAERADTDFVSPTVHTLMYGDLATLEDAAKSVIHDDGQDAEYTAKLVSAFVTSINENIARVNNTANRPNETAEVKTKCQQIQRKLSAIRRSFQPDAPASAAKIGSTTDSKMVLPTASSANTTTARLQAAQTELKKALTSLNKSQTANHGGLIEKGRADATLAVADVGTALAYVKDHPELEPLPPGAPPTDQEKFAPAALPSNQIAANGKPKSPNVAAAMDAATRPCASLLTRPRMAPARWFSSAISAATATKSWATLIRSTPTSSRGLPLPRISPPGRTPAPQQRRRPRLARPPQPRPRSPESRSISHSSAQPHPPA
jgi:hypothetical protein